VTESERSQAVLEVRPLVPADAFALATLWTKVFVDEVWGFDTFAAKQDLAGPIQGAAAECEIYKAVCKPSSRVRCDIESA
jgi:hypothetical protein